MSKRYWLFKTEPESFSWEQLENSPDQTTHWGGVRNYQARNVLRDDISVGDEVLLYYSSVEPMAVIGICEVMRAGYPDFSQFDPNSNDFDRGAQEADPRWYMVDIAAREKFTRPVLLSEMKELAGLERMALLQRGSRLSIQPVTPDEWKIVVKRGRAKR